MGKIFAVQDFDLSCCASGLLFLIQYIHCIGSITDEHRFFKLLYEQWLTDVDEPNERLGRHTSVRTFALCVGAVGSPHSSNVSAVPPVPAKLPVSATGDFCMSPVILLDRVD